MRVGAALIDLRIRGAQSLKARRGVVQSIKRRVRNRFNVSVAEVDGQDTWQRAVLALAATGGEARVVRSELVKALDFIEGFQLAEVVNSDIELVELPREPLGLQLDDEFDEFDED